MTNFALRFLTFLGYASVAIALVVGWQYSSQRYLVPDDGLGYWLGILGGSLMLALLLYPVRKKHPRWTWMGTTRLWFRLHMVLGTLGPTLIVFHANYKLGSLNSQVAFFSMCIVAASGLIGRYLYRRVHHGLYGRKIEFVELYPGRDETQGEDPYASLPEKLRHSATRIEADLVNSHTGINRSLFLFIGKRWRLRQIRQKVKQLGLPATERDAIINRLWQLRSICNLGINEIIFSYWHILHYPLFVTLVFSGIIHVVVVHYY